ncbi:extracellular solute-binding protein [Paenibacillus sp. J5C_2022]|uniref:extracellular solute-binding protein n=1 Tax=Paenibacillus sp. J5C2022 TaxID=2977129 RepID=UPI0021D21B2A|nr:extracellular solute-binding protein [Paenibacillus sp. J5C2022]MCU6710229.1 extracellular solute-binding protein [Paenibacillus sp. J5C2022]
MTRVTRRSMLLALAMVTVAATLMGCTGKNESQGNGKGDQPPSKTAGADSGQAGPGSEEGLPMKDGKYDPPVTITTVKRLAGAVEFKNGETADDNVHYRWAKEKLGIEIKNLWSVKDTNGAYATKLKLALSSNEKMPDVLFASGAEAQLLIDSGKFMEVGELFDKYASDTWKKAMNEDPTVWYEFTRDGKRYGIPNLDYDYNNDPVLWVRGDWMTKLALEPPANLEDYEKLLDAFTNGDPDGDGQDNTYGVSTGLKNFYGDSFGLGWVFGAYGSMPSFWLEQEDGSLAYGSVLPQIKEGLQKLKDWVQKGYIPLESSIWDASKAGSFMSAGSAGSFAGPYWSEAWPMGDLNKNNPDAELITFTLPIGPDGTSMHYGRHPYNGGLFINKDMSNPEIFFTYANYMFDHAADPKVGSEFENGWAQGYDWDIVDGEVTYDLSEIPGGGVRVFFYGLLDQGPRIPSQNVQALVKIAESGKPETPYEKIWGGFVPPIELQSATDVWNSRQFSVKNAFTGGATATMESKWDYLQKLEMETYSKIIFGNEPVEAFDAFVEKWNAQGGERITKEVNEWYKSVTQ